MKERNVQITYKKNFSLMVIAVVCLGMFCITLFYSLPRLAFLMPGYVTKAEVSYADKDGKNGYDTLKTYDEDGNKHVFYYYYSGNYSHLTKNQEVLVLGDIVYVTESTEYGVNSNLIVGTQLPVIVCLCVAVVSGIVTIILLPGVIQNFIKKPWASNEEINSKNKIVNVLWTLEIFALLMATILFMMGISKTFAYLSMKEHTTGNIIYQGSRQSSQATTYFYGSDAAYKLTARYAGGIHLYRRVFQIKLESSINDHDEIWYEGSNLVFRNKKVYVGYEGDEVAVLTSAEKLFAVIGGGFLLLHIFSAFLICKWNKYGGKIFWFYK